MPRGRPKKVVVDEAVAVATPSVSTGPLEKEKLLALYKTLLDLGIRSIGDLENKIANTN